MRGGKVAVALALVVAPMVGATSSAHAGTPALPVAWRAPNAATLNEPALTANGLVTTADNVATARGLAHGSVLWKKTIADQMGFHMTLGAPTVSNGVVDAVVYTIGGDGVADFAVPNGALTMTGPTFHILYGQLVVNGATSTRVTGSYGSGVGPFYENGLGGHEWYLLFGPGYLGTPAVSNGRAFVPVQSEVFGEDPAQGCNPLPVPNPPPGICAPTWHTAVAGTPQTPVTTNTGRVITSDNAGVVTALNAATGAVLWSTPSFGTPLAPPAYANGVVYVGGEDDMLRALDATTGALKWTADAGMPIHTAPTVTGGRAFLATDNGRLVTFKAAGCGAPTCTRTAVGNAHEPGTAAAGPPLVRNHIAVVAFGSHLVAFAV